MIAQNLPGRPVPVLLLVFNRPAHTRQVLNAIRAARPSQLFVVADGPRPERPEDTIACAEALRVVESGIDWQTDARFNVTPSNMGLRQRVSSGISWLFEHVDEAIILEDDCVPDATFFHFCAELLERYRNDQRVGAINGTCFQSAGFNCEHSYYFSRLPHPWGWATWRRAWRHYDADMKLLPEVLQAGWLRQWFPDLGEAVFWERKLGHVYAGRLCSWAYVWFLSFWAQSMLAINPAVNLISNIGFGAQGTHTLDPGHEHANLPAQAMAFPLRHPRCMVADAHADAFIQRLRGKGRWKHVWRARLSQWLKARNAAGTMCAP